MEDVRTQRLLVCLSISCLRQEELSLISSQAELARLDNLEKHHDLESNLILNKRGKTTEVSGDAKIKVGLKRERQGEMHVKREGEVKHRRVKASKPTEIVDLTGGQGAV